MHELVGIFFKAILVMWEFFFFFCMTMEKFGSCVWICEKILIVVKCCWGIGCKNIFWVWNFLVLLVLVMEIDKLKFCVAKPQESR